MDKLKEVLETLNVPQRRAVEHLPDGPLQILAGPGSGKTKALTARIAYMILVHLIPPWAICAVTFTNKAANEMRARLAVLVGVRRMRKLKMGTFHALCAVLLRKHGLRVGLAENFTICDADESEKLVGKLLKPHKEAMEENNCTLSRRDVHSKISRAKGQGFNPDAYRRDWLERRNRLVKHASEKVEKLPFDAQLVYDVFRAYERELRRGNAVDFDDLLIFGVRLVRENKKVVKWCRHVLVDEFQDTNTLQYDLMRYIAADHDHITIVGDPDQSIYGWRSADIRNLQNMQRDFPRTQQILLEQNYRSTASILDISLAIIAQDKRRIPKSLHTSHPMGPRPMLCGLGTEQAESLFIAAEIKRLVAASGGMLSWQDFVVLLRFNALSRNIEAALQIEGIPNRVLKGHKFFERAEIKDILAYLQIVDNHRFLPAFLRTINTPPRGLGEKSVSALVARAESEDLSALEVTERICDGTLADNKPGVRKKIAPYVKVVRTLRKLANERLGPADLIREVVKLTEYEAYLRKGDKDFETRKENVDELITFATLQQDGMEVVEAVNIDKQHKADKPSSMKKATSSASSASASRRPETSVRQSEVIEISDSEDEDVKMVGPKSEKAKGRQKAVETVHVEADEEGVKPKLTPLREFLEASMLSTDASADTDEGKDKVTLSTCHAAKGLEWPVVFVPAVVNDVFPMKRAEDVDEERRLLYVAATRAQGLLYMTHSGSRMMAGETKSCELSQFVRVPLRENPQLMVPEPPRLEAGDLKVLAAVLGRPEPEQSECKRATAAFDGTPLQARLHDLVAQNFPWPEKAPEREDAPYVRHSDSNVLQTVGPPRHNGATLPGFVRPLANPSAANPVGFGGDYVAVGRRQVTATHAVVVSSDHIARGRIGGAEAGPSRPATHTRNPVMPTKPPSQPSENAKPLSARDSGQKTLPFRSISSASSSARRARSPSPDIVMLSDTPPASSNWHKPRSLPASSHGSAITTSTRPPASLPPRSSASYPHPNPIQASPSASRSFYPEASKAPLPAESRPTEASPVAGVKRRLGMGRPTTMGYSNKKFKKPAQE